MLERRSISRPEARVLAPKITGQCEAQSPRPVKPRAEHDSWEARGSGECCKLPGGVRSGAEPPTPLASNSKVFYCIL